MLVRNLSERDGTGKVRSFWENKVRVVVGKKGEMPVYEVKQEDGNGRIRVLHRNLLLPCSHLPTEEVQVQRRNVNKRNKKRQGQVSCKKATKLPTETENDEPDFEEIGFTPQALETLYDGGHGVNPEHDGDMETVVGDDAEAALQTSTSEEDEPIGQEVESDDDDNVPRRTQRVSKPPNRLTYDYMGQPSIQPCVTARVQGVSVVPQQWWGPPVFQWYAVPGICGQPWSCYQPGTVY